MEVLENVYYLYDAPGVANMHLHPEFVIASTKCNDNFYINSFHSLILKLELSYSESKCCMSEIYETNWIIYY